MFSIRRCILTCRNTYFGWTSGLVCVEVILLTSLSPAHAITLVSCVPISLELMPHRGANASCQICTQSAGTLAEL